MLFLIDLSSRRVEIAGVARQANGLWMSQVARNLSDTAEGFLVGKRYLIHDRDPLFTAEFLETLATSGVQSGKTTAEVAEPERARRAVRENHQGVLLGADDPFRRGFIAKGHPRIR